MCPADPASEGLQFKEPYEKFMYQHLQYYGYFRGERNIPPSVTFLSESIEESSLHMLKPDIFGKRSTSEHNSDKNLLCSIASETARLKSKQLLLDPPKGPGVWRLREPRNLSSLPNGRDSVLAPFWPIECEVIENSVHHVEWIPPEPEPFYQPTGNEYAPDVVGEEHGTVVYSIDPAAKGTCFTGSRVGGSREPIKPAAPCSIDPEDTMLLFESRFESGNLQKAVRVGKYEYELTLRTDLYTSKHTQWYYFRVQNTRKDATYRFTIVNLMKAKSLYSVGMKPLLYSQKDAQLHGVGWRREGSDIKYYKYNTEDGQTLYCLTWTMSFRHSHDTCYFAHFYPYTYSDLQRYLLTLVNNPVCSRYCKLRPLCGSLAGNTVYLLTITNPSKSAASAAAKKAIVLSARVHPGETNSSWVMRGFLDFILSDAPDAQLLRDLFIFKIVPMLNPDGVIVGNYRCSLAGRDLNRNYRTLLKESFPCIWYTRAMVKRVLEEREILLYCDLHGHSRKNNVFMYGCNNKHTKELLLHEQIFPLMLSKNIPDKFSFNSCKFRVQKCKEGTGRVVMWRMGILNSYTMESTFSGSTLGRKSNSHFTSEDLKTLGYHLCDTLLDFCDPDRSKFQQCLSELKERMKQKIQRKLSELGHEQHTDGTWSDISLSDVESSTSGSDSSQSDGPPAHLISMIEKDYNEKKKKKKKKRLRTRKERNNLHQNHAERLALKDKEDVPASTISPSHEKCHSLSKGSQSDNNSEQKRKQMNRVIFMYQAQNIEDTDCSSLQRENLNNFQKFQEPPLGKQIIPLLEYEMKITAPQPLLITTISPLRQSLPKTLVKQHPSPVHGQPDGEHHRKKNPGLSISSSSPGLKRYRSLWCYPEVPSLNLMLRRSLALKFHSSFDNGRLWHMSQSRSQIISHGEFKWKPLQVDRMLLRTESRYHAKGKGPSSKMEQKHSLLEC